MSGTLIHLPNWLGDSIMAMPAVASLVLQSPPGSVVGLCKPAVKPLWSAAAVPLPLIEIPATLPATLRGAEALRSHHFDRCIILPNSWRSAFIPFSASIPIRRGFRGHWRSALLTDLVEPHTHKQHLSQDYAGLLGVSLESGKLPTLITVAEDKRNHVRDLIARRLSPGSGTPPLGSPVFGLLPGAARGPSKMWPGSSFIALGKLLQKRLGGALVVLGAPGERALCQEIAEGIGGRAWSFAGTLSFEEGLAMMELCDALVSNDSGGMHMAWALNRPLVAVFGITDPDKTGPLGPRSRVLQESDRRSTAVPRDCPEARAALLRISPEQVCVAVESVLIPASP